MNNNRTPFWKGAFCLAALGLTAPLSVWQPVNGQSSTQSSKPLFDKPLFDKPLFPDPLFSDDNLATRLDNDIRSVERSNHPAAVSADVDRKISTSQVDEELRRQMRDCARYLIRYGVRNGSRFPGNVNDEMYAAQVQLTELVPNNPYSYGTTEAMTWGIPSQFNGNRSTQTGAPVWGDQWTEHLQAQQLDRIRLSMDYSMTPAIVDGWTTEPPGQWEAPPGTISCIGNNQGLFIVWGAGRDGKPIKNASNGRTFIISGTTSGTVNDRSAPNPGT